MSNERDLSVRLVALRVLADRVQTATANTKDELAALMTPGDRKVAALDSGDVVGGVTYAKGKTSARITDPAAFTAWVQANYPGEIQPQVRPAFLAAVLAASKKAGVPMTPDGTLDVPGVAVGRGEPYLTVTSDPLGLPALVDAIRANGLLALDGSTE